MHKKESLIQTAVRCALQLLKFHRVKNRKFEWKINQNIVFFNKF